jgi:type I restriction enzyme M protein
MHSLYLLAVNGTAAILSFPGIMYRTKAEQKIRKYLIDNNFVEAIIQLPEKLFHGVDIATCILVLKKNKINNRTLFIDASKEFIKGPNQNKLSTERNNYENNNIKSILDLYMQRDTIEYKSYLAKRDEIEKNDYNLSVSTYVEKENTQKVININVLNENIKKIVQKENILRDEIDKIILQIEENN